VLAGERQVAPDVSGIRRDHVARYEWAAQYLSSGRVLDLACGIGYGAQIFAKAGHTVHGVDRDREAITYALKHYRHERASFWPGDDSCLAGYERDSFDAVACFETIEHIEDPLLMLRAMHDVAPRLLASVPNEEVFPYLNHDFHFRHYTRAQFMALLAQAGWRVKEWWGQLGPESEVERDVNGRTLIAVAERAEENVSPFVDMTPTAPEIVSPPGHVTIIGLGPSCHEYLNLAKGLGARRKVGDEIWAINALGDVLKCDRIFHMDDVRIQEVRAAARPDSNIAAMLDWLKSHPGPIYTSRPHPNYPGLVAYPLADVLNSTRQTYFNNTAAYAVAYAIHIGVKKISCYGMDFTYPNAHDAERGRGCVEFWLGLASARGIQIRIPRNSSLMDGCEPKRFYGYDTVDVNVDVSSGAAVLDFAPLEKLPTADEIEARYNHGVHPNPYMSGK
jgi:SAM-dependent methyltransferase